MTSSSESASGGPPMVETAEGVVYTLEIVAELAGLPSQTILEYQEQGLISPAADAGGFDEEALRRLRRIEHLRLNYGMTLPGLRLALEMLDEIEHLRACLRGR